MVQSTIKPWFNPLFTHNKPWFSNYRLSQIYPSQPSLRVLNNTFCRLIILRWLIHTVWDCNNTKQLVLVPVPVSDQCEHFCIIYIAFRVPSLVSVSSRVNKPSHPLYLWGWWALHLVEWWFWGGVRTPGGSLAATSETLRTLRPGRCTWCLKNGETRNHVQYLPDAV